MERNMSTNTRRTPLTSLGGILRTARGRRSFIGSRLYWEQRYAAGGSSGCGSYGAVAAYKAEFLNGLVYDENVKSVIEFGSGDGNQLTLSAYPAYVGLDVSPTAISVCRTLFANDHTKSFFLYSPEHFVDHHHIFSAEMAISLDVILHLVEDSVFDTYMRHLFAAAQSLVAIYSSDSWLDDPAPHVRHRAFSPWVETNRPNWALVRREESPHRDLALADFYVYRRTR
jgi:hypothetical protein